MMATYSSVTGCTVILLAATCGSAIADSGNQDGVTVGIMGENAPRYSGADKQHWTVMPSLQVRKGAFFFDSTKGIGYDLQTDNGLYFENAFGYSFGRADQNSSWRDGSDKLKGMGNIRGALNTQVAVGWQVNSWFTPEIRATLPLTDSQGVQYQASLTLVPWQND
ncbi:MipA/OmpV family protein, partial [Klebsiella pneumoniae]|nr:MipA/OmpV family protein [Klebsiella pneumoniae]